MLYHSHTVFGYWQNKSHTWGQFVQTKRGRFKVFSHSNIPRLRLNYLHNQARFKFPIHFNTIRAFPGIL